MIGSHYCTYLQSFREIGWETKKKGFEIFTFFAKKSKMAANYITRRGNFPIFFWCKISFENSTGACYRPCSISYLHIVRINWQIKKLAFNSYTAFNSKITYWTFSFFAVKFLFCGIRVSWIWLSKCFAAIKSHENGQGFFFLFQDFSQ